MSKELLEKLKLQKLEHLQKKKKYLDNLPHLYGFKFYKWTRTFWDSRNRMILLVAGNQLSKSSTQIRKFIYWATEPDLWQELWPKSTPRQFWYLYPTLNVATAEVEMKWIPEFMPREEMKTHPQYGWRLKYKHGQVNYIEFNTGIRIYFHAYSKDSHSMQSGTVHAVGTDEELVESLYDELSFRLAASEGYFSMVFTATRGQELWYKAMERIGKKDEAFPQALKIRVSAWDCLVYEDGDTDTPWSEEKIQNVIATCATENEVLKRVHGRFVVDDGLLVPEFKRSVNVVQPYPIPKDWNIYTGVDVGSGGKDGHKGAIIFVAVNKEFTKGAVFKGWKGTNQETTTAADILDRYRILRGVMKPIMQLYDWASKDFFTFASRLGESFTKAEKSHEIGIDTINTLFKLNMLDIFDIEELQPLIFELQTLTKGDVEGRAKRHANDDMYDAKRYVVTSVPWDWSAVAEEYAEPKEKKKEKEYDEIAERRKLMTGFEKDEEYRIEKEIEEFNDLYN